MPMWSSIPGVTFTPSQHLIVSASANMFQISGNHFAAL